MDMFGQNASTLEVGFAKAPLKQVLDRTTGGQKGKNGLSVKGAFFYQDGIKLDIEIENFSGGPLMDFDIMFNKNPFALAISGAAGKVQFPPPG